MESAPATPGDPYRILKTGDWPLHAVNPRAIAANVIESGALVENYPSPSFGPPPLLPPVPEPVPLSGDYDLGAEFWTFDWRKAVAWAPLGISVVALVGGVLLAVRTTR